MLAATLRKKCFSFERKGKLPLGSHPKRISSDLLPGTKESDARDLEDKRPGFSSCPLTPLPLRPFLLLVIFFLGNICDLLFLVDYM